MRSLPLGCHGPSPSALAALTVADMTVEAQQKSSAPRYMRDMHVNNGPTIINIENYHHYNAPINNVPADHLNVHIDPSNI